MPYAKRAALLCLALSALTLHASAADLVFRGATIYTAKQVFENGVLVVRDGKIAAVGPAGTAVPEGAKVVDVTGKVIIPGLVDTHSHIGVYSRPSATGNADGNEMTGPVQGVVRAVDAINPDDPGIRMALAGGVTTANIMPGSGNVMGGQTAYVKLRGRTVEDMLIHRDQLFEKDGIIGGMKMANGENPKRSYGSRNQKPATRMGVSSLQRQIYIYAQEYRRKRAEYRAAKKAGKKAKKPERDLAIEPVVDILERKRMVHFHTHRADDILSAMRLADEFGFRVTLHHVSEGYKVAEEIARRKIACSIIMIDSPGGKLEAVDFDIRNGGVLERAGVQVSIHTDDPITSSRVFLRSGALAIRGGMSEAGALKALTIHAADQLDLADRIGSLEKGKDADFAILDGAPFSIYSKVLETWIEGAKVFDRGRQRRYATGGYALERRYPRLRRDTSQLSDALEKPIRGPQGDFEGAELIVSADAVLTMDPKQRTGGQDRAFKGSVLIKDGKVLRVVGRWPGPNDAPGVERLRAKLVTPGLIDTRSVIGLGGAFNVAGDQDQNEATDPDQSDLRALEGFNPSEKLVRFVMRNGVTTIQTGPGPANPIAGQAGIFKTFGLTANDMCLRFPSAMVFTLGEAPKSTYRERRQAPGTRLGTAALIRRRLNDAREYRDQWARYEAEKKGDRPKRDLKLDALAKVVSGELPALIVAHRKDDIMTALRISREFSLKSQIAGATEGYLVAPELKAAGFPVFAGPTMVRMSRLELNNASYENAAIIAAAGNRLAISSGYESYVPKARVITFEAGVAAANGLGFLGALRAVTLDAAEALGVADRVGSLTPGKDADILLFDADPFETTTRPRAVIVNGRVAYARR